MNHRRMIGFGGAALLGASLAVSAAPPGDRTSERLQQQLPASVEQLKLPKPLEGQGIGAATVDPALIDAKGKQRVIVRLRTPSVAKSKGKSAAARMAHKEQLKIEQSAFVKRAGKKARSMKQVSGVQTVLNAVFLEVNAKDIPELATDRDVLTIHRVRDYELHLTETVPYIGASAVQGAGFDGTGVRVAVLDSGVDYYHADLGGSGVQADYIADDPTLIEPGSFPTAKVVDGYDFLGNEWPFGPVLPDPDPLDDLALVPGAFAGHGTHVADIIGGAKGVAPGAEIVAVKVCASLSSSCNGVALIQGMEFAVDPDGNGDPSDAVDIINMSLGADYGQPFDDDLSQAVEGATALGVLTVSSAGNGGDRPYVTGTPSSAPSAIAVAQTAVPSATVFQMEVIEPESAAGLYDAVKYSWTPDPTTTISGPVLYGDGAGGNLNGCAPFAPGSLAGQIVAVDRGACFFSDKIRNIENGGGVLGIVMLVAPGDPFDGAFGGGDPISIPGFNVSQATGNILRTGSAVVAFGPDLVLPLVGTMVSSSSRGPQHEDTTLIKPEIGAPGASISAVAGSGTGVEPFGGTSGASPMVAGSAALLLEAFPDLSPAEVRAKLMNTAETEIETDPISGLAPITRIGGGEVRVDRALAAPAAAWDEATLQGGLSFGFADVDKATSTIHKKVRVRNFSDKDVTYGISPTFRYQDDADNGAVSVSASPKRVRVKAGSDATFNVKMTIDGYALRGNAMNSGSEGVNPAPLTLNEYDGYLVLDAGSHQLTMPWHILPRQAANVVGRGVLTFQPDGTDEILLTNNGAGTAQNDAYSLLAVSPNLPEGGPGEQAPTPDIRAVGVNTFPVPAGFCSAEPSFIWAFAINTWERQQHLLPVLHVVNLDTDQDGTADYQVYNYPLSFFQGGGALDDVRQVTVAANLSSGSASAFFFTEHATNTGNTVLLVCGEQVGLTGTDLLATNVDASVQTFDFYYGGPGDSVDGLTITPLGERYFGEPTDIPPGQVGVLEVTDFGPFPGNSEELGVLLFTNGDRGTGARGGATEESEALLITAEPPPAGRPGGFGK